MSSPPTTAPRPTAPAPTRITTARPAPTPPPAAKSRLAAVKRGQLRTALRHLFYGVEGVGKSSLAADAPAPIFLDVEGGADNLDVARYPFRVDAHGNVEPNGHVPRNYDDVTAAIEDLIANPGHGFGSVVIDTVDALEALVHRHLCEKTGRSGIEDFGYGKGYKAAVEELRRFLARLDVLRASGVRIILLGHSAVTTFKNPEGEDFDRYQLHVHRDFGGQIKEWCDVVGFIRFDGGAAKLAGDAAMAKRARGWSSGKRIIHLAREAAWDAKCRLSLPAELELATDHPWRPFAEASEGARESTRATLEASIAAEIDRITGGDRSLAFVTAAGRETSAAAILDIVATGDDSTLTRVLAGLRATAAITTAQES